MEESMKSVMFTLAALGLTPLACTSLDGDGPPELGATEAALTGPTVAEARAAIAAPSCQVGVARWGAADQAGQSNTQNETKMLEAATYIKPGARTFQLGHPMKVGMPEFPFPTLVGYEL